MLLTLNISLLRRDNQEFTSVMLNSTQTVLDNVSDTVWECMMEQGSSVALRNAEFGEISVPDYFINVFFGLSRLSEHGGDRMNVPDFFAPSGPDELWFCLAPESDNEPCTSEDQWREDFKQGQEKSCQFVEPLPDEGVGSEQGVPGMYLVQTFLKSFVGPLPAYKYTKFTQPDDEIRRLKTETRRLGPKTELFGTVTIYKRSNALAYKALSYTWGDEPNNCIFKIWQREPSESIPCGSRVTISCSNTKLNGPLNLKDSSGSYLKYLHSPHHFMITKKLRRSFTGLCTSNRLLVRLMLCLCLD